MKEQVRKFSPGLLIKTALQKWRLILLIGILLGGALAVRKARILYPMTLPQEEEAAEETTVTETTAVEEADETDDTSVYEQELKRINSQITAKQEYMVNSLFAEIDFTNENLASADVYVKYTENAAEETSDTGDAGYVSKYLFRFITSGVDWTELAEEMEIDASLLREQCWAGGYDADLSFFYFAARGRDAGEAERIRDYALEQMLAADWSDLADPEAYQVIVTNESSYTTVDSSNFGWHTSRVNELNALLASKDTYQTNINKNRSNTAIAQATTTTKKKSVMSKKAMLISCAKHGAAGFVGGAGLTGILLILWLMISGKVLSGREFNGVYGMDKLAVLPKTGRRQRLKIDRWLANSDGRYQSSENPESALEIAAVNLKNRVTEDGEKILITGDLQEAILREFTEKLSALMGDHCRIEYAADLNRDPRALGRLEDCDAVVIAAGRGASRYSETDEVINTVRAYQKPVIGSVVL